MPPAADPAPNSVDPTPEQLARFAATPETGPVVMINLLAFAGPDGAERYQRYGTAAMPLLEQAGARVLLNAAATQTVIGDGTRPWWDAIVVVEYPSHGAFLAMVSSPGYAEILPIRSGALTRAELIATAPAAGFER